ncbi:hypothetical protein GCM10010469_36130 [Streptomyces labedae]|uniref:Uncharacterized protein n=1 Tax=Streptomyces labedae TaxID=285569 RepID=A0ABP6QYL1_9ACTN
MRLPADQLAYMSSGPAPRTEPARAAETTSTVAGSDRRTSESRPTSRATAQPLAVDPLSMAYIGPAMPASTRSSTVSPAIRPRDQGEAVAGRDSEWRAGR